MTNVGFGGNGQAPKLASNSEAYFRSFCLSFIRARGRFERRKQCKKNMDSARDALGLSLEEVHRLFRQEVRNYEDTLGTELSPWWGVWFNRPLSQN